jgi:hypothetical protein
MSGTLMSTSEECIVRKWNTLNGEDFALAHRT